MDGFGNFYSKVDRYYTGDGKDALLEAIRETARLEQCGKGATIRDVLARIDGDEEATDLFWRAVNDDVMLG